MDYINADTLDYPLTEREVKARFPAVSIWARPFIAPTPYAYVHDTPPPEYDPITHRVEPAAPELTDKGLWETRWLVVKLPQEAANANFAAAVEQARARAHERIVMAYVTRTQVLAQGYPEDEQKSWPIQVQEADIILADDEVTPTPWIDNAALARGISRGDLALLIKNNDTAYRTYHGTLSGVRQTLRDEIDGVPVQAGAIETLDAIQWPNE